MIRLTWGDLRNQDFMQALSRLYGQPMGYALGLKLAMVGREIKKQQKLCSDVHEGILKKFGYPDPDKRGFYKIREGEAEAYQAEMEKLDATEFFVNVSRIDGGELSKSVSFSPQDLMLLEPLLDFGFDEVDPGKSDSAKQTLQESVVSH